MRCEHCNQNEATTYIKQNINGKVTEMHLCRDCAEKLGVLEPMHSNMGLGSMFEGSFFGNFCGSTFNDIINTGNVGCAHCYDRFADKLEPSIRKIHGATRHIGKNISYTEEKEPVNNAKAKEPAAEKPQSERERLQAELDKAVQEQRYEDAAVLRDQIKELKPEE